MVVTIHFCVNAAGTVGGAVVATGVDAGVEVTVGWDTGCGLVQPETMTVTTTKTRNNEVRIFICGLLICLDERIMTRGSGREFEC